MAAGTVRWFNATKGFGYIMPDDGGRDVFVHISALEQASPGGLRDGQKVDFSLDDQKGEQAVRVNLRRVG